MSSLKTLQKWPSSRRVGIRNISDYSPFGVLLQDRTVESKFYRKGFNGKEKLDEISKEGNSYDYGYRIYNPRLARFLSLDPLSKSFPWYTPFQFAGNKPTISIDLDGMEEYIIVKYTKNDQLLGLTIVKLTKDQYLEKAKIDHAKLVNDIQDANNRNQQYLSTLHRRRDKARIAEVQASINKNNSDLAASAQKLTELEAQVNENFSKVLIEDKDVANGGVNYYGFSTLKLVGSQIKSNPGAYSQGKALSDEMDLKIQNIIDVGAPAIDELQGTDFYQRFLRVNEMWIDIPQVMNINFSTNSAALPSDVSESLDNLFVIMVLIPDMKVDLVGHTDNVGSDNNNQILSEDRANAAMQYLINKGISPDRISATGKGESAPISTNDTEEGKQQNRRIEIIQKN